MGSVAAIGTLAVALPAFAAGAIENSAIAKGAHGGEEYRSEPGGAAAPLADPVLAASVSAGAAFDADVVGDGDLEAGDAIAITVSVTNTSNATLVDVTPGLDGVAFAGAPGAGAAGSFSPAAAPSLAPGASQDFAVRYTLGAADIVRAAGVEGGVTAEVSAAAAGPGGAPVAASASAQLTIGPDPELTLEKSFTISADANGNGLADVGDEITYVYLVTNTGNVALTGVTVVDDHEGVVLDSAAAGDRTQGPHDEAEAGADALGVNADAGVDGVFDTLGAGGSARFTYVHTVTQAEFDRQ